mmetsp:Transcript_11121/g.41538  ORF Transcript_11121/g.41538 Transcript_11121/m.41538 type:complete len:448 (-) Transcript_11121:46-1389(-)
MRLAKKIFILLYESEQSSGTTTLTHPAVERDNSFVTHQQPSAVSNSNTIVSPDDSGSASFSVTSSHLSPREISIHGDDRAHHLSQCAQPPSHPPTSCGLNSHDAPPLGTFFSHYQSHIFHKTVQHINLLDELVQEQDRRKQEILEKEQRTTVMDIVNRAVENVENQMEASEQCATTQPADQENNEKHAECSSSSTTLESQHLAGSQASSSHNLDEFTHNAIQMERSLTATDVNNGADADDDDEQRIEQKQVIFNFLYCLKQQLCNEISMDWDEFNEQIYMNDHETVTKYLTDKFGEDGILTLILKSCHQTIIAKVLRRLRETGLTFKDVRGSWRIQIRISKCGNYVSSLHRRKEQMIYRDHTGFGFDNEFQFEWELETFYNVKSQTIDNVEVRLLSMDDVDMTKMTHPKECKEHREMLQRIFAIKPARGAPPESKLKQFHRRFCSIL